MSNKDLLDLANEVNVLDKEAAIEELKQVMEPLVLQLENLDMDKKATQAQLDEINKQLNETETKIRKLWEPHIIGAEKATLDFGSIKLHSEQKLNVSVADEDNARDNAISWLCANGYKDVMKYDINTNTMKSIANSLLKESDTKIPGLKYSTFNKLKLGR